MAKSVDGKVKLTEAGSASLRAWMRAHHFTATNLADLMGTHAMTPGRALRGHAFLSLEQVGRIVARTGGELTAEMLVGMERANAIPVLPVARRAPEPTPPRMVTGAAAPDCGVYVGEEDDDGAFGLPDAKRELLKLVRSGDTAPGVKAGCLFKLAKLSLEEAEREREREKTDGVREVDLLEKFETLLFNARRQAEMGSAEEKASAMASALAVAGDASPVPATPALPVTPVAPVATP